MGAAEWITSPEVTAACQELKRQRLGTWVVCKPDGTFVSRLGDVDKYGPSFFSHEEAEKLARVMEEDYGWPEGSVEVLPDWMAE